MSDHKSSACGLTTDRAFLCRRFQRTEVSQRSRCKMLRLPNKCILKYFVWPCVRFVLRVWIEIHKQRKYLKRRIRESEEATVRVISLIDIAVNIRQGGTDEAGQTSVLIHDNSISTRQKIANYTFAQTMVSHNQNVGIGMSSSRNWTDECPSLKTESRWINPVTVVLFARAGCNLGGISCGVFIGRFGGRFVFVRCNSTS